MAAEVGAGFGITSATMEKLCRVAAGDFTPELVCGLKEDLKNVQWFDSDPPLDKKGNKVLPKWRRGVADAKSLVRCFQWCDRRNGTVLVNPKRTSPRSWTGSDDSRTSAPMLSKAHSQAKPNMM